MVLLWYLISYSSLTNLIVKSNGIDEAVKAYVVMGLQRRSEAKEELGSCFPGETKNLLIFSILLNPLSQYKETVTGSKNLVEEINAINALREEANENATQSKLNTSGACHVQC